MPPTTIVEGVLPSLSARSLRWEFSWLLCGRLGYVACQWVTLLILVRLGGPEIVGQYSFALAVSAPTFALSNLSLRKLLATDARGEHSMGTYLGLRVVGICIALLVIAGTTAIADVRTGLALLIGLTAVAKAVESASDLFFGELQRQERSECVGKSLLMKGAGWLVALVTVFYTTGSLALGVLALLAIWTVILMLYDIPQAGGLEGRYTGSSRPASRESVVRLARFAAPLGVVDALTSFRSNVPRYFLAIYHGDAAVGIFSALVYVMVGGDSVFSALRHATAARLARLWATAPCQFRPFFLRLVALGTIVGLAGVFVAAVAGADVLRMLYGEPFAEHAEALVWIMLAATASYAFGFVSLALVAMRRLMSPLVISIATTIVGVIATWWLVPRYGTLGAAWALCITTASRLLIGLPLTLSSERYRT